MVAVVHPGDRWGRWAWMGGIVYVLALLAESAIAVGIGLTHDESAAKIARVLHDNDGRLIAIACLSIVYAAGFTLYLWRLYTIMRGAPERPNSLSTLVLVGGVLFVTLHAVSDVGITGLLGAKAAGYSAAHDEGVSYSLYYLTYALDSVGDVFASLGYLAAGAIIFGTGVLPRWLGSVALLASPLLFLQAFGLGGVIASFGLVLDLVGFLLLLLFVIGSSVAGMRRELADPQATRPASS